MARVFRTYNSSQLYQDEILKLLNSTDKKQTHYDAIKGFSYNTSRGSSGHRGSSSGHRGSSSGHRSSKTSKHTAEEIIKIINDANIAVAMLCNHQKNITKRDSLKDKIAKLDKESKSYKEKVKKIKEKEKSAHLALGTSKLNYIDPRITVATLKRFNILLDKYFNARELTKFQWATSIEASFIF